MKPTQGALLLLLVACVNDGARASDWGYCLAPADADNRIYLSRPFPSRGAKTEREFDDLLTKRDLRHDSVQCPRADDEQAAVAMRRHAVEVNRLSGRQVIDTPWCAPP